MPDKQQEEAKMHHYWQKLGKSKQRLPTPRGYLQLLLIIVAEKHSDSEANHLAKFYGARERVSTARNRIKRLPGKVTRQKPKAQEYYKQNKKQILTVIKSKSKGGESK